MHRIATAILLCGSAASAATFTLEQITSAPFPSEMHASPDGNKVAWVLNERGARNVWLALLWGGSYGGYLTALGLARASDLFKAGVDFHGVHDWNIVIRNFDATYDARNQDAARVAFESSPMASVSTWRSPVLLIHGDDDRNVPFSETVTLVEALRKQGVYFEQLIFPDDIHDFLLRSNWLKAYAAAADFFARKL